MWAEDCILYYTDITEVDVVTEWIDLYPKYLKAASLYIQLKYQVRNCKI